MADLAPLVEAVVAATRQMATVSLEDSALEQALALRGEAITQLARAVRAEPGVAAPADAVAALRQAFETGGQTHLRLTLGRAALRQQLEALDRELRWAEGVSNTISRDADESGMETLG